ncbi:hypothetical protein M2266_002354 [Streptomyces sp. SPB162]|nr:hypothetical protein [Streptomyces sp. SPB162]
MDDLGRSEPDIAVLRPPVVIDIASAGAQAVAPLHRFAVRPALPHPPHPPHHPARGAQRTGITAPPGPRSGTAPARRAAPRALPLRPVKVRSAAEEPLRIRPNLSHPRTRTPKPAARTPHPHPRTPNRPTRPTRPTHPATTPPGERSGPESLPPRAAQRYRPCQARSAKALPSARSRCAAPQKNHSASARTSATRAPAPPKPTAAHPHPLTPNRPTHPTHPATTPPPRHHPARGAQRTGIAASSRAAGRYRPARPAAAERAAARTCLVHRRPAL